MGADLMSEQAARSAPTDERAWIAWAQIALKFDGVDKALQILGMYLALNPAKADQLAAEWEAAHADSGQR